MAKFVRVILSVLGLADGQRETTSVDVPTVAERAPSDPEPATAVPTAAPNPIPQQTVDTLNSLDWTVRRNGVRALAGYPPSKVMPYVEIAMRDADHNVRLAATQYLSAINSPRTTELLLSALEDHEAVIIDAAADALKQRKGDLVGPLTDLLTSQNENTKGAVIDVLRALRPVAAVPYLITALADTSKPWLQEQRICDMAAEALEEYATAEALQAVNWWRSLQRQQEMEQSALHDHGELFVDAQAAEPETPAQTPEPFDPKPVDGLPLLQSLLDQIAYEGWGQREDAAKRLRLFAEARRDKDDNQAILARLCEALTHDDWVVRVAAVEALAWVGDPAATANMTPLLNDDQWMVRVATVRALTELRSTSALRPLCVAMGDPHPAVRESAAEALGMFADATAMPSLQLTLSDEDPNVRLAVVNSIWKINSDEKVPLLLKSVTDEDPNVRWTSMNALQHVANEHSVPILALCLEDESRPMWEDERICDLAAKALKRIGTPEAMVALQNWEPS